MRECKSCLHWTGWLEPPDVSVSIQAEYCRVHREHFNGVNHLLGCDSYWPRDGAKCETCRFATEQTPPDDQVVCHLVAQTDPPFFYKTWFCENWKARE